MVTYLVPAAALAFGVAILDEAPEPGGHYYTPTTDDSCDTPPPCHSSHPPETTTVSIHADQPAALDVQLYKVADAMRVLSLSRTVIFELTRSGRLRSVKQGRTRLIPTSAIRDYVTHLKKEAEAA